MTRQSLSVAKTGTASTADISLDAFMRVHMVRVYGFLVEGFLADGAYVLVFLLVHHGEVIAEGAFRL